MTSQVHAQLLLKIVVGRFPLTLGLFHASVTASEIYSICLWTNLGVPGSMCLGQCLAPVSGPWLLLKPRSKLKPSVTDSPGQMQSGACFLWYGLPTLVLEQGQVGLVEEHWPLEMQPSNEPDLRLRSLGCSL